MANLVLIINANHVPQPAQFATDLHLANVCNVQADFFYKVLIVLKYVLVENLPILRPIHVIYVIANVLYVQFQQQIVLPVLKLQQELYFIYQ